VSGAQVIKDQFLKCKSTPMTSLQFGFNEVVTKYNDALAKTK
jgi:hypothetical protein